MKATKYAWFEAAINGDAVFLATHANKHAKSIDNKASPPHYKGFSAIHYAVINRAYAAIDVLLPFEWTCTVQKYVAIVLAHTEINIYIGTTVYHLAFLMYNSNLVRELLPRVNSPDCRGDLPAAMLPLLPYGGYLDFVFEDEAFISQVSKCRSFLFNSALFGRYELIQRLRLAVERGGSLGTALAAYARSRIDALGVLDYAYLRVDYVKAGCTVGDRVYCYNALKDFLQYLGV